MTYEERVEEFKRTHTDWDGLMKEVGHIPVAPELFEIIRGLENGPRVTYYLALNPEFTLSLSKMRTHFAAFEIGRLAAKLESF